MKTQDPGDRSTCAWASPCDPGPLSVGCGLIFLCQSEQLSWFTRDVADLGIEILISWEALDPGHTGTIGHHTHHISSLTV